MSEENDGRLSFNEAVAHVIRQKQPVFAAVPVFGERTDDENQTAEGVRIIIIEPDPEADGGDWRLRFIAGPFFANAYAANDIIAPEETPDSVRELRFMPTRCEEAWFGEQMQILVQKLVKAAGVVAEQMPDYENAPSQGAGPEAVFPISFIGRGEQA